jgi:hypothetical protein
MDKTMIEKKAQKLVITVDNIQQADAIALIKMFKHMQYLGVVGSSRWCSFFADGDGSFRPKVSFDYPEELPEVPEITGIVEARDHICSSEGDFKIDSDSIAWKIYH